MSAVYDVLAQVTGEVAREDAERIIQNAGEMLPSGGERISGEVAVSNVVTTIEIRKLDLRSNGYNTSATQCLEFPDTSESAHAAYTYNYGRLDAARGMLVLSGGMVHHEPGFRLISFLDDFLRIETGNTRRFSTADLVQIPPNVYERASLGIYLPRTVDEYDGVSVYTAKLGHGANSWLGEGVALIPNRVPTKAGCYLDSLYADA